MSKLIAVHTGYVCFRLISMVFQSFMSVKSFSDYKAIAQWIPHNNAMRINGEYI